MNSTFILQHHNAERAGPHQDLYLEDGINYRSFAIPKGLPAERGVKRLAIKVADHTPKQVVFEGEITEGYGKGFKEVIDEGAYWEPAPNIVELHGGSINGRFHLEHWKNNHWLIWLV